MTDRIDLTRDELDAVIAHTLSAAPFLGVVLRAVRAGEIGYVEVIDARTSRVLALSRDLPMLLLVHDLAGLGPEHFGAELMARLCRRACGVTIVVDHQQQPDDLAYAACTEHVIERQQPVLLVETDRRAVRDWVLLARAAGRAEREVCVMTADPDQPNGFEQIDLDDFTTKPPATGPVH